MIYKIIKEKCMEKLIKCYKPNCNSLIPKSRCFFIGKDNEEKEMVCNKCLLKYCSQEDFKFFRSLVESKTRDREKNFL